MSENEGTKQGTEEPKTDVQQEAKKERDDTVEIRKGELAGYKTQLRELKKQLEELTNMKTAEEEAKLKAAQNWDALEKQKAKEIEALRAELDTTRRTALTERARSALHAVGIHADLTVAGALSKLPADIDAEAIPAWVAELQKAHPDDFKAPTNPIGAPSAGPTGRPTSDPVAQLKAAVKAAKGKGPVAMDKALKAVDEWMKTHPGRNPLAEP